jgi:diguanylate cyclase (GGDEF)-like protein
VDCLEAGQKNVVLAINTRTILFFKCKDHLTHFVIPIRLSNGVEYALIDGRTHHPQADTDPARVGKIQGDIQGKQEAHCFLDGQVESETALREITKNLQTLATILLENIHRRNQYQYQSKSSHLSTLIGVSSQFRKDLAHSMHYITFLNTLGSLFPLESAGIFHQTHGIDVYRNIASFGDKKTALHQSEVLLDHILNGQGKTRQEDSGEIVEIRDPASLRIGQFPEGIQSCTLFPLSEDGRSKVCLVIFDTILPKDTIKMIALFCQQVGAAIETVTLQNEVFDRRKTIQSLSDLGTFDVRLRQGALCNNLLEQTTQILGAEQGSLMIHNEETNELIVIAMKGINPSLFSMFNIRPGEGIAGKVYENGLPLLVQNVKQDPQIRQTARPRYKTDSFVIVPLKEEGRTVGLISLADKGNGHSFSKEDLDLLQTMGSFITMAMGRSALHEKAEELREISITDPLTGLLNRRYLQERLTEELERSNRHGLPICLIMVDIDDFKQVNDTYGHSKGDEAIKSLAEILRKTIRSIDVASRYGGEEFTVMLPQTDKKDAHRIAERLRQSFSTEGTAQLQIPSLTISIGLSSFPEDADSIDELIDSADRALYQAKRSGKNRVIVSHGRSKRVRVS